MLSPLELSLAALALVAGMTGSWSPCGFSMIATLGGTGHDGGRRVTLAACATFSVGALAGGVTTFGGLAALGALARFGGDGAAAAIAAAIAAAAALAEARGARILPQIRRQVPEHWRRTMPLTVAAALYGLLLGLGFTTFVLTFAVWALAGISVALGSAWLGLVIGLAFGIGRALPVAVIAPLADGPRGMRIALLMAERPATLRAFRFADAAALSLTALLLATGSASAAVTVRARATDPSVFDGALTWQDQLLGGVLRDAAGTRALPGRDPALGKSVIAWRNGDVVTVARRDTGATIMQLNAPGVDKLAVSDGWLVYRVVQSRLDLLYAAQLPAPGASPAPRLIAGVRTPAQLGRPMLDGDLLVYHVASPTGSDIIAIGLTTGRRSILRRARPPAALQLLNPSALAGHLLYLRVTDCTQQLRLGALASSRHERVLLSTPAIAQLDAGHEHGHTTQGRRPARCPRRRTSAVKRVLWTTSLSARFAYVTRLSIAAGVTTPSILRVSR